MKVLIDIGHPAHVHLFKNLTWELQKKGHAVLFTTREKEVIIDLLKHYGFSYISFGKHRVGMAGKLAGLIEFDFKMFTTALNFKPSLFISHNSPYAAQVSWLLRKPHIALEDTGNIEQTILANFFNKVIITSSFFDKRYGRKQIFYDGYHESAYLRPNQFQANPSIKSLLGVKKDEKYIIVRFISWAATHDYGHKGLTFEDKLTLVKSLENHAKVFITSEKALEPALQPYKITVPPYRIHDAFAFASLIITEGTTVAKEAAMLGVPSLLISDITGLAVIDDQKKRGLVFGTLGLKAILEKAHGILYDPSIREELIQRRGRMLSETIDLTAFLVWFVENYPQSFKIMKRNPEYQHQFGSKGSEYQHEVSPALMTA